MMRSFWAWVNNFARSEWMAACSEPLQERSFNVFQFIIFC